jgi:hypothetical protein
MYVTHPAVTHWTDQQGDVHRFSPRTGQRTPLQWAGLKSLRGALGQGITLSPQATAAYVAAYALLGLAAAVGNGLYGAKVSGTGWGIARGVTALFFPAATTAYSVGQASCVGRAFRRVV